MTKLRILPHLLIWSALLAGGLRYGDFYLFHLIGIVYVGYLCLNIKDVFKTVVPKVLDPVILFFVLYCIYPLFFFLKTHEEVSLIRVIYNGFGLLIMIAAIQIAREGKSGLKKLFMGLAGVFTLHLLLSTVESFGVFRWPISSLSIHNRFFGIDFFKENYFDYGTILASPFNVRATSFYWSINTAAFVSLLGVPFITLLLKNKLRYLFLGLSTLVILASGSRWIIGLMLVYLICFFVRLVWQKNYKTFLAMLTTFLATTLVFMVFIMTTWHNERIFLGSEFIADIFIVVEQGKQGDWQTSILKQLKMDESVRSRGEMLFACVQLLKNNTFFGYGPGILSVPTAFYDMGVPHFYWIEIMVEYGVIVFAFYMLALALMAKRAFFNRNVDMTFRYAVFFAFVLFGTGVIVLGTANYFLPKWALYALVYVVGTLSDLEA